MNTPERSGWRGPEDLKADAQRRVVTRAMRIGSWTWPSFAILDAYMCFVAYPGAPFGLFLVLRGAVSVTMFAVYRASLRHEVPVTFLVIGQNANFGLAALTIAVMAMSLGGPSSPYMHGITIVALVRAAVIPERWRRAWPTFAIIGLAFPLVMGVGAALSPAARAAWLNAGTLTVFASNYVFVIAAAFLGLVSSNIVWEAQEQVYRARRVGRYRLQAPIGKGGMGEVWLAWDLSLQRNVALKVLRVGPGAGPEMLERFEREALAASRLQSPHVIRIFDYGASDDGLYYIAMEYLTGMDLNTLVEKSGPVSPRRACLLMMQLCRALAEAHAAGLIHRDIKPHNLFVTHADGGDDFVKLLDFGIVRFREPGAKHLTWTGMVVGTPGYLAPELRAGAPADERSDIYAMGVTLHFLLTGSTPSDVVTEVDAIPSGDSSHQRAMNAGPVIGPQLNAIIQRCMAPDPQDRVRTADELFRLLAAVSDGPAANGSG